MSWFVGWIDRWGGFMMGCFFLNICFFIMAVLNDKTGGWAIFLADFANLVKCGFFGLIWA